MFVDVSVIVAAYQAAATIERTLLSIATQTVKPREVIVVDDGSTDGTATRAEAVASRMGNIGLRIFRTDENQGASAARNLAIAESTQPVLAFLDADDEWLPAKLERSMAHFQRGEHVLVAHDYVDVASGWTVACAKRFREACDPFVQLYRKGYIPSCSVVARRDAVTAVGGFDPGLRNAQDFDLWLAMLRLPGTPFLVFDEPLLRYYRTPGGIMTHTERRLRCGIEIALRYYPDLVRRPGSAMISLWYRVAVLHAEAFRAHRARGNMSAAGRALAMLPVRLLTASLRILLSSPARRPGGLGPKTDRNHG